MNLRFERSKIEKEIKRSGKEYEFKRIGRDKFGEDSGEIQEIGKLKGLYHEQNGYIKVSIGESNNSNSAYRSKKTPMILCLYEDAAFLECGDFTIINGAKYIVNGKVNVQNWDIAYDISLEVFDDGR